SPNILQRETQSQEPHTSSRSPFSRSYHCSWLEDEKGGAKKFRPALCRMVGGEEFLNLHQNFEQPEAKGIVKTIRLPIPKRLSVWHRPASVSNRRCCRNVSRLGQWSSVLNGEHDQEIRLDWFLRRFHYRQHAAAA